MRENTWSETSHEGYIFLKNERIIHHATINEDRKPAKLPLQTAPAAASCQLYPREINSTRTRKRNVTPA